MSRMGHESRLRVDRPDSVTERRMIKMGAYPAVDGRSVEPNAHSTVVHLAKLVWFRACNWLYGHVDLRHFKSFSYRLSKCNGGGWATSQMGGNEYIGANPFAFWRENVSSQLNLNYPKINAVGYNAVEIDERRLLGAARGYLNPLFGRGSSGRPVCHD